jgi:uncharacterized integral membrane protein (TIGR00698 family)
MQLSAKSTKLLFIAALAICFIPQISPGIALAIGLIFAFFGIKDNSFSKHKTNALQISIILMGFGMNLEQALSVSKNGFTFTAISVIATFVIGLSLAKLLKVNKNIGALISSGTAICGGSAIAAVAPIIEAEDNQITFSLVVVFVLNAIALFLFPIIGHLLHLDQTTFGYWAAIAIHDTSSVVGAGAAYGAQALEIATIVKLTRALWIIPLSLGIALFYKRGQGGKIKIPWFILYFALAIIIAYLTPQLKFLYDILNWLGRRGMVAALFLIGSNMSVAEAKKAGVPSFALGVILWIIIGAGSLFFLSINLQ